jgi:quercetin dioxygenase-like cupin family protein
VKVHNVGPDVVNSMARVDLATVDEEPASLIGRFDFNLSQCGVASFTGSPPWELHPEGDELLHILSGECRLTLRNGGSEETCTLKQGDITVVPRGCWHRNFSPDGVTMLYMTPKEGNQHSWTDPKEGVT